MHQKVQCPPRITILGIGNILFRDDGVGVRVVEKLQEQYRFPDHVQLFDGGVLGLNLMGIIADTDSLIIVDAVKNGGQPGDLYRMEGDEIPRRVLAKNSLHQVDIIETLTLCGVVDKVPPIVVVGIEPRDIDTMDLALTDDVQEKIEDLTGMVLVELGRMGVSYERKPPEDMAVSK